MRKSFCVTAVLFFLLLLNSAQSFAECPENGNRFKISRGCGAVTPKAMSRETVPEGTKHFIVQFYEIPDAKERSRFEEAGIRFYRYIGGNAYLASKTERAADVLPALARPEIRAVLSIPPEMKISGIFRKNIDLRRKQSSGKRMGFRVRFFPGTSVGRATEIVKSKGLDISHVSFDPGRTIEVNCAWPEITNLSALEEVEWIDHGSPARMLMNKVAAERGNVNHVWKKAGFRRADGANTNVGVWDGGPVDDHPDLKDRVIIIEDDEDISWHATHVSGTIASSGKNKPAARGMAPAARIYSYDFLGNVVKEMKSAVKKYGISISSNSWGTVNGWSYHVDTDPNNRYMFWAGDWSFGYYHDEQVELDDFLREFDLLAVFAAGNDRGDSHLGPHKHEPGDLRVLKFPPEGFLVLPHTTAENDEFHEDLHPSDPEYGSVATWACAKNNLVAGATMKDDVITGFSCWGPTDDGRVKPDVVANGYGLLSTTPDGKYERGSGTSMSTPTTSGTAALLHDYYYRRHGTRISGLSLKNLVIHSARDLGRYGPDYIFGHGIVDGEMGARVVRTAVFDDGDLDAGALPAGKKKDYDPDMRSLMVEDTLDHKQRRVYRFTIPENTKEFRATLVWHDPSGSKLVNDLDLVVKPFQSKTAKPFVLDRKKPEAAAKTGRNRVDNVESIKLLSPNAGTAMIFIKGRKIPQGPQKYSLIVSAGDGNRIPETKTGGSFYIAGVHTCNERENYAPVSTFQAGDPFYAVAWGYVPLNADYGDYYGSQSHTWVLQNAAGEELIRKFNAYDRYGPGNDGGYFTGYMGTFSIPSGLPIGIYTVKLTVTLHNGQSETGSYLFQVR